MSLFTRDDIPPVLRSHVPPDATLTFPPQGMTSEVALVGGETPCVIKRCRDRRYLRWLFREHRVLLALANSSLPVPRVLGFARVHNRADGREAWLVMSRLDGRPLWNELLHASSQRRARLLRRVGELLKQLHATAVPIGLRSAAWVDRMLAEARNNLEWCDGTAAVLASLHDCRPAPVPDVLIHGDLALDNVLVAAEDAMSLIDWSGGAQGDPRYDVSLALHTEPEIELGEAELAAFFDGYGGMPWIDRPASGSRACTNSSKAAGHGRRRAARSEVDDFRPMRHLPSGRSLRSPMIDPSAIDGS